MHFLVLLSLLNKSQCAFLECWYKCTHIGAVRVGLVEGVVLDTLSCLQEGESGHIGNT